MPKNGQLDEAWCYLIGSMEFSKDQGVGWREEIIRSCANSGLKIIFLDPTNKIAGLQSEVGEEHNKISKYKKQGKWTLLRKMMKAIVREDHRCVDLSDFVIFYLDTSVHNCGSYFEFQSAMTEKKPYFVIIKGGKSKAPSWLFGICDHNNFYNSVEEVVRELLKLNSGKKKLSDRWVLFRKRIAQNLWKHHT